MVLITRAVGDVVPAGLHGVQPWVAEHQEIRPAAEPLHWVARVGLAGVEERAGGCCQMASGGKANKADAVGDESHRRQLRTAPAAPRVAHPEWDRIKILCAQPVLEHKGGDTRGR